MDYSFGKKQKLTGEKNITTLMKEGNVFSYAPLRTRWRIFSGEEHYTARVAFSVPKKNFKKANKRNLLKRRMREAYRKNKGPLVEYLEKNGLLAHILIVYAAAEIAEYGDIESKIILTLQRIKDFHEKNAKRNTNPVG